MKLHKLIRKATVISMLLLIVVGTADTVSANYKAESTEHPACTIIKQDINFYQELRHEYHGQSLYSLLNWTLNGDEKSKRTFFGLQDSIKDLNDLIRRAQNHGLELGCVLVPKLLP